MTDPRHRAPPPRRPEARWWVWPTLAAMIVAPTVALAAWLAPSPATPRAEQAPVTRSLWTPPTPPSLPPLEIAPLAAEAPEESEDPLTSPVATDMEPGGTRRPEATPQAHRRQSVAITTPPAAPPSPQLPPTTATTATEPTPPAVPPAPEPPPTPVVEEAPVPTETTSTPEPTPVETTEPTATEITTPTDVVEDITEPSSAEETP